MRAEAGEPHFRELEPAERVAAADRAPSTSSVSERSAAVCGRPTWFDSGPRSGLSARPGQNDRDLADPEDGFVIVQAE